MNIVVVVLSQDNEHHSNLAKNLRRDLYEQADVLHQDRPIVHLSHEDFPHVGAWTVLPLIPELARMYAADIRPNNISWIFFAEDRTQIRLNELLLVLEGHSAEEPMWLGHALHDQEATIIHHFAFYDDPERFKYPNAASGMAISTTLLKRLADRLREDGSGLHDFGIDSAHELAMFVWQDGAGHGLRHTPEFCLRDGPGCATFSVPFQQCGDPVSKHSMYFAVKTCSKFHKSRVPVVQQTWAQHVSRISFFSDVKDDTIPTESVGVPNTEHGHCGKTMAIIRRAGAELERSPGIEWVIVADDDTILGVSRLQKLLSCYDPSKPMALGERYGYNVHSPKGYNYITGGGGMVFSRALIAEVGVCECPSDDAPDDMFLGVCMAKLGVNVTHSPMFHQARPVDYSPGYLNTNDAVSFHRHWMIDPISVYNQWFAEDDRIESKETDKIHSEL